MRNHDPFSHRQRGYTVPQLDPDPARRPLVPEGTPVSILAVVDRYAGLIGGIAGGEMMLHHLIRDSAARGHNVMVATNTPGEYEVDGVTVVPRREAEGLADQAHVVLGHLMWTRLACTIAGRWQRPLVYLVHNDAQLRHWNLVPDNVTSLVWNSRWVHDLRAEAWQALRPNGVAPGEIIPPPVFVDDYQLDRDPWEAPFVTLVNTNPEKGGPTLYRLAARPPARRYLAVQGGYGEQQRPSRNTPNVEWQPQTTRIRDDVYARTRVLIVPSQYESWGRVAIEAMSSGIPVVAAPTPGLREALGDAAQFVDLGDHAGWERALAELDTEATYRSWSDKARRRAVEMSDRSRLDLDRWDRMVREAAGLVHPAAAGPAQVPSPA